MLMIAKTALHNLAKNPEFQAFMWMFLLDVTIRGGVQTYDTLMDKAAKQIAAEIRKKDNLSK